MTIKISKNSRIISGTIILFVGMFSGYLGNPALLRYGLIVLIFWCCLSNLSARNNLKKILKSLYILVPLFTLITIINVSMFGDKGFFGSNLRSISYVFFTLLLIQLLASSDSYSIFAVLRKNLTLINFFGVVNLIITTIQVFFIHGFFIKNEWLENNSFYEDLCCGLFGSNATHEMTYFFCFWMLLNIYEAFCVSKQRRKWKLCLFIIGMTIWMFVLSAYNDNVAFLGIYTMLVVMYIMYYTNLKYAVFTKILAKYTKYIIMICGVILIILSIPVCRNYIWDVFFDKIGQVFQFKISEVNGSNERLAIVAYALQNGYGMTGIGLGTHGWFGSVKESYLGFAHFGLNSSSSFIMLGGVPFYAVWVLINSYLLWKLNINERGKIWLVAIIFIVIVSSTYTVIFTSYVSAIWLALSLAVFAMTKITMKGNI